MFLGVFFFGFPCSVDIYSLFVWVISDSWHQECFASASLSIVENLLTWVIYVHVLHTPHVFS